MSQPKILSIDFASLNTLCIVHAKGSFSAAAVQLDTNQSTISYTINRLREVFDDPLFVRQGGKIVATPRCDDLTIEAQLILEHYNTMVKNKEFDPSTSRDTIRIASNYYERVIILPSMVRAIRMAAPNVHIQMVPAQNRGPEQLQDGTVDLLLSPASVNFKGLYSKKLVQDRYVCLMDRSNPLATGDFTEEMFRAANHAYISFAEIWQSQYGIDMRRKGLTVNRAVSVASPENMSDLLVGTDLIAAVPDRIAQKSEEALFSRECPFPAPFQVSMHWTVRTHRSKMHSWLRDLIVGTTSQLP